MLFGVMVAALCVIPLFSTLGSSSTFMSVTILRGLIVVSGIAFAAPYHAWALELVPAYCRSILLCFGYALGSQVIGTPATSICLFIYQQTRWVGAPGLYLFPVALGALWALWMTQKEKKVVYS
jgi:hypothetical protein